MNEKAKKYVDLFRRVKIAAAATVDAEGHPQARIINVMLAEDDGMYIVTSRGKPFYKQLVETGEIALAAMCPDCQSLKFTGKLRVVDKSWVDKVFAQNPGMNEVYPVRAVISWTPSTSTRAMASGSTCSTIPSAGRHLPTAGTRRSTTAL